MRAVCSLHLQSVVSVGEVKRLTWTDDDPLETAQLDGVEEWGLYLVKEQVLVQ